MPTSLRTIPGPPPFPENSMRSSMSGFGPLALFVALMIPRPAAPQAQPIAAGRVYPAGFQVSSPWAGIAFRVPAG